MSGAMPVPVSLTDDHGLPVARCRTASFTWPPGGVYLAALFSRLEKTCVSRTRVAAHDEAGIGQLDGERVPGALDQRAAQLDRVVDHAVEQHRAPVQVDLAARDARDLHQVVDQAHHVVDLAAHELVVALGFRRLRLLARQQRQGGAQAAPADCAARAPAWRGTRSCAGRPRAGRRAGCAARTAGGARATRCAPRSPARPRASAARSP